MRTNTADTAMHTKQESLIKPESEMTTIEKLGWGIFWGTLIGGAWLAADFIRPFIYGA